MSSLLRFLTCGSVDDGKSTLIGRLLYEAGVLPDDQLAALAADSRRYGTQGDALDFALAVDGLSAEREQGITIDVAYRYFSTARRRFIVADTPGHEQYTRNMATGASTADAGVILVDARKGLLPQTRRHGYIVSLFGMRHVVLAVNKMDLAGYSRSALRHIEATSASSPAASAWRLSCIPVAARAGREHDRSPARDMPWYRGPTLLEHLERSSSTSSEARPFRFPVQWVNRPTSISAASPARSPAARCGPATAVRVLPSGARAASRASWTWTATCHEAVAGQSVTLTLADDIDVSPRRRHRARRRAAASRRPVRGDARLDGRGAAAAAAAATCMKVGTRTVPAHRRADQVQGQRQHARAPRRAARSS